ncbi:MAG: hypothetical protein L6R40_007010 [Gallowayella cf. fulva]|nr:MAG: hypothetical protein L6R40_007010 [Xanthomendoza cf. fulva]
MPEHQTPNAESQQESNPTTSITQQAGITINARTPLTPKTRNSRKQEKLYQSPRIPNAERRTPNPRTRKQCNDTNPQQAETTTNAKTPDSKTKEKQARTPPTPKGKEEEIMSERQNSKRQTPRKQCNDANPQQAGRTTNSRTPNAKTKEKQARTPPTPEPKDKSYENFKIPKPIKVQMRGGRREAGDRKT